MLVVADERSLSHLQVAIVEGRGLTVKFLLNCIELNLLLTSPENLRCSSFIFFYRILASTSSGVSSSSSENLKARRVSNARLGNNLVSIITTKDL